MMMGITPMQAKTLEAIRSLSSGGVPPSMRELQDALGLNSVGGVHRLVHALRDRGMVTFAERGARSIRILGEDDRYRSLATGKLRRMREDIDAELRRRAI